MDGEKLAETGDGRHKPQWKPGADGERLAYAWMDGGSRGRNRGWTARGSMRSGTAGKSPGRNPGQTVRGLPSPGRTAGGPVETGDGRQEARPGMAGQL